MPKASVCLPAPRGSQHSLAGLQPHWGRVLALRKAAPGPLHWRRRWYQSYRLHHPSHRHMHTGAAVGMCPHRKRCAPSAACLQLPSVPPGVARRLDRGAGSWHSRAWLRSGPWRGGTGCRDAESPGSGVPGKRQLPARGRRCSRWRGFVRVCECGESSSAAGEGNHSGELVLPEEGSRRAWPRGGNCSGIKADGNVCHTVSVVPALETLGLEPCQPSVCRSSLGTGNVVGSRKRLRFRGLDENR